MIYLISIGVYFTIARYVKDITFESVVLMYFSSEKDLYLSMTTIYDTYFTILVKFQIPPSIYGINFED